MGLYIPNAKIPGSCNKCYEIGLAHRLHDLGGHCPRMDLHYSPDEQDFKGDRRVDCPLIELPPHGRLIDADALISDGFYTVVCYTGKMPYAFTAMRIADAPTIIPADPAEEDE